MIKTKKMTYERAINKTLKTSNNIFFLIEVKISSKLNISETIKLIKNKIEMHCLFLTDKKPKNITINYVGYY